MRKNTSRWYWFIFSGLFFITFHIYYGTITIMPSFFGYIILFLGIVHMAEINKTTLWIRARKACTGILLLSFIDYVQSFIIPKQWIPSIVTLLWTALLSVIDLLLIYHILLGSAEWLHDIGREQLAVKTEKRLYRYILLFLLLTLGRFGVVIVSFELGIMIASILLWILQIWLLTIIIGLIRAAHVNASVNAAEQNVPAESGI